MNAKNLYSIRMRASDNGEHVSGAERIAPDREIEAVSHELIVRARRKMPLDKVIVQIEKIDTIRHCLIALDVVTINAPDVITAQSAAARVLRSAGVSAASAIKAVELLSRGASRRGGNMHGATIMDAESGERLEQDQDRGVRVSRFDWTREAEHEIMSKLATVGLTHYRTREALALATKVAYAPGVIAELCWSDEPDYTAGYVASLSSGYVRFPALKQKGDPRGGRAFFVNRGELDMESLVRYLELDAVLVVKAGRCTPATPLDEYFISGEN